MANYKYQIEDVIAWFLSKGSMTPKKLQKLLYYAYSWDMVFENEDSESLDTFLFNRKFQAWVHGPVIPEVWREYRSLGWNEIDQNEYEGPEFDEDTLDTLEQVWEEYGRFNGNELESITHQEEPWKLARKGCLPLDRSATPICDKVIFQYYGQRLVEENV